jgi:hypothetical protein
MEHHSNHNINPMAASATLHCLTGCAIGEVLGLVVGMAIGLTNLWSTALAVILAFVFGFGLSAWALMKGGIGFKAALSVVVVADTLSILTMEIVDNGVELAIPGAMNAGLANPIFWWSMPIALTAAYIAAFPVNRYLLSKGKGHALTMQASGHHHSGLDNETKWLLAGLIIFIAGGLLLSLLHA